MTTELDRLLKMPVEHSPSKVLGDVVKTGEVDPAAPILTAVSLEVSPVSATTVFVTAASTTGTETIPTYSASTKMAGCDESSDLSEANKAALEKQTKADLLRKRNQQRLEIEKNVLDLATTLNNPALLISLKTFRENNQKVISRKRRDFNSALKTVKEQIEAPVRSTQTVKDLYQALLDRYSDLKKTREDAEANLAPEVLEIVLLFEGDYLSEIESMCTNAKAQADLFFFPPKSRIDGYDKEGNLVMISDDQNSYPASSFPQTTTTSVLKNPYQFAGNLDSKATTFITPSCLAQPLPSHSSANYSSYETNLNFARHMNSLQNPASFAGHDRIVVSEADTVETAAASRDLPKHNSAKANGREKDESSNYRDKNSENNDTEDSSSSSSSSDSSDSNSSSDSSSSNSDSSDSSDSNDSDSDSNGKKKSKKKKKKKKKILKEKKSKKKKKGGDISDKLAGAMFHSQKLNFDITRHMKKKFSGGPDGPLEYPGWLENWKANRKNMRKLQFSNLDLFWELKKILAGDALDLVSSITHPTENSYKECMKLLDDKYGLKDVRISNVIEKLINLPTFTDDAAGVSKGFVEIKNLVKSLDEMHLSANQQKQCYLMGLLKNKIPNGVLERYNKKKLAKKDNKHPLGSRVNMKTFWKCWAETEFMYSNKKAGKDKDSDKKAKNSGSGQNHGSGFGRFRTSGATQSGGDSGEKTKTETSKEVLCIFGCKKGHKKQIDCPKLHQENLKEKDIVSTLQKNKACYHCFSRSCDWKKCKENAKICELCNKGKHNPFLCRFADEARASKSHAGQTLDGGEEEDEVPSSKKSKKKKK